MRDKEDTATDSSWSDPLSVNLTRKEEKEQRRRIQNRINQRAKRLRAKGEVSSILHANLNSPQYEVQRWRIDEHKFGIRGLTTVGKDGQSMNMLLRLCHPGQTSFAVSVPDVPTHDFHLPTSSLLADHLLHLIHYNVFRGLHQNKCILNELAVNIFLESGEAVPVKSDEAFCRFFAIKPVRETLPDHLEPTKLQRTRIHATWINFLPFSQLRDNLIRWQDRFDHWELAKDVLGIEYVGRQWFRERKSNKDLPPPKWRLLLLPEDDDEITAYRHGLIIWGEPYRKEDWEATPGFLRKWMWAVDGCEDLIASTNYWRIRRGEEPLYLEDISET